jgi:monoamine oxidase
MHHPRMETSSSRPPKGHSQLAFIGAGAAGLYAAMLLQSLGIHYEILEGSDRIGGRMYIHRFDEPAWNAFKSGEADYYNYYVPPSLRDYMGKLTRSRI